MYISIVIHIYIYIYICVCVCAHKYMRVYIYVCGCICEYYGFKSTKFDANVTEKRHIPHKIIWIFLRKWMLVNHCMFLVSRNIMKFTWFLETNQCERFVPH